MRKGDDIVECLSIEIKIRNTKFRCVGGYGPQLEDDDVKKDSFWKYLEEEVYLAPRVTTSSGPWDNY